MADKPLLTQSYIHVPCKSPFLGLTVGQQLYVAADKYADKEMFVFYEDQERITFKEMKDQSQLFAASLLSKGIAHGDTVAILGGNHVEWMIVMYACAQLGVALLHCRALVLTRSPFDLFDKVSNIIPEVRHGEPGTFNSKSFPDLKLVVQGERGKATDQNDPNRCIFTMSDFLRLATDKWVNDVSDICATVDIDDWCLTYFTSGTTGLPKAVALSHHALLNNAVTYGEYRYELEGPDPKWEDAILAATMSFAGSAAFSSTFLPVATGCTTVVLYTTYNVDSMVRAIQDERVTEGIFFIHHVNDLVNYPNISSYDFTNLRIVTTGGSIVPQRLRQKVNALAEYSTDVYGMTEILIAAVNFPKDSAEILEDAALVPVSGVEMKIVDDDGCIVPVDTLGEMLVRTFSNMICYTGEEDKTKDFIDANGWSHTGDVAKMDKYGHLRIRNRKKDIIIKEAVNLSPAELEAVLYNHPAISGALVVGLPDTRRGEEVCACCIRTYSEEVQPTKEEIIAYCTDKVFQLLIPKYVLFVEEFPTTENGKFSRKDMKAIAMDKLGIS